jgi:hypothetical protein
MTSQAMKIGAVWVRQHIRSGIPTGRWYLDVPPHLSETGKRSRQFYPTREIAEERANSLVDRFEYHATAVPVGEKSGCKFSDILSQWFARQEHRVKTGKKKKSSVEKDLTYVKSLQAFFGDRFDIAAITESLIESYQERRQAQGIKPVTINSEVRTLQAILRQFVRSGHLKECPTVEILPEHPERIELPNVEEMQAILHELPSITKSCSAS